MTALQFSREEVDDMPFIDAVELFEYWAEYPPVHLLVRAYLGFEGSSVAVGPEESKLALKLLAGGRRAQSLDTASSQDQQRFFDLKKAEREMRELSKQLA
jgi:hypothetical protein